MSIIGKSIKNTHYLNVSIAYCKRNRYLVLYRIRSADPGPASRTCLFQYCSVLTPDYQRLAVLTLVRGPTFYLTMLL